MTLTAALQAYGIRLELLTSPLTGIYDPDRPRSMLFAVSAVAAQLDVTTSGRKPSKASVPPGPKATTAVGPKSTTRT
jgi:hypothetical protein